MAEITLNDCLDVPALRDAFRSRGRLQIRNVLSAQSAEAIHGCLSTEKRWNLVCQVNNAHLDMDAQAVAAWSSAERAKLTGIVHTVARDGFQYLYEAIPVYDMYHQKLAPGHFLNTVFEYLNGSEFLNLARQVTNNTDIAFADAQATRYTAGHFLNCHDDNVAGKNRLFAYVLSFSQPWRSDWGGLLQFFRDDGNVDEAFVPSFNSLALFQVPASHSVSFVSPFAGSARYSITGWLRSGSDPCIDLK